MPDNYDFLTSPDAATNSSDSFESSSPSSAPPSNDLAADRTQVVADMVDALSSASRCYLYHHIDQSTLYYYVANQVHEMLDSFEQKHVQIEAVLNTPTCLRARVTVESLFPELIVLNVLSILRRALVGSETGDFESLDLPYRFAMLERHLRSRLMRYLR